MSESRLPKTKKSSNRLKAKKLVEYFHPREHAILAEYLELEKNYPKVPGKLIHLKLFHLKMIMMRQKMG